MMINKDNPNNKITKVSLLAPLFAVLLMIVLLMPDRVSAAGNFYITDFRVDVKIHEDDTYRITETLDVDFTAESHGIYRNIPYLTELDRDGQKSAFKVKIKDFKMLSGQKWKDESDSDYFKMRFGDPDKYEKEKARYKYSYTYDMRGDHLKDGDEFFYNLVGTEWEAKNIDKVDFKITFPERIDPEKVGIKASDSSYSQEHDIDFNIDENNKVITGSTTENVMGGLTMRAVLPSGYFSKQAGHNNIPYYTFIGVLVILAVAGFLMWYKYGNDKKMVRTVEFQPPEGLSSEITGYLYDEMCKPDHIISILLELADKGYVKIVETKKNAYKIVCLKEYNGGNKCEKMFMDGLFNKYKRKEVTRSQLGSKFYKTFEKIQNHIEKEYESKLYDEHAGKLSWLLKLIGTIAFGILFAATRLLNGNSLLLGDFWTNLFMLVLAPAVTAGGFAKIFSVINKRKIRSIFSGIMIVVAGMIIAFAYDGFPLESNPLYPAGFFLCVMIIFLSCITAKKTDWYIDIRGKIMGYRDFLTKTEKDRIEKLVEQDPDYYYRNLAYAYALNITEAYAKRFRDIVTEPPVWFESSRHSGSFSSMVLHDSMRSMMRGFSRTMTSVPSGSGSGGGSFSSGGGAGGGGGGSW